MARNRVIYQSEALFVSPVSTGAHFACSALLTGMGPTGDNASKAAPQGLYKGQQWQGNPIGYLGFSSCIGLGEDPYVTKGIQNFDGNEDLVNLRIQASGDAKKYLEELAQNTDVFTSVYDGWVHGESTKNDGTLGGITQGGSGGINLYTNIDDWNNGLEQYFTTGSNLLPLLADKNNASIGVFLQPFYGKYENLVQQIHRVQSANYSFTINRQDVNVFGQLSRIDAISLEPPTVNLDFTYYPTDGFNERNLGIYVQGPKEGLGVMSGTGVANSARDLLKTDKAGGNYFILTTPENSDAFGSKSTNAQRSVIGLGNGYLSDYTFEASVGSIPSASVTVELFNATSTTGTINIDSPGISTEDGTPISGAKFTIAHRSIDRGDRQGAAPTTGDFGESSITALRPGDIVLEIPDELAMLSKIEGENGFNIQNFSISMPLSRTPIERIGSKYAFARAVDVPLNATMNVSALVSEIGTGNLAKIMDDCNEYNVRVKIKGQQLCGSKRIDAMIFDFKGARLDSESVSSDIGSNKSVDLTWTAQLGGIEDLDHGVFISGANSSYIPEGCDIPGRSRIKNPIKRPEDAVADKSAGLIQELGNVEDGTLGTN